MSSSINQADLLLSYQRNMFKNFQNSTTSVPQITPTTTTQQTNNAQAAAAVAAMAAAAYTSNLNNLYSSTAQQMQTLLQPIVSYDYSNFITNKDIDHQNRLNNNYHTQQISNVTTHSTSSTSSISSSRSSSSSIPLLSEPISPVLSTNYQAQTCKLENNQTTQINDSYQQQQQQPVPIQNPFLTDLPIKLMHENGSNQDGSSNSRRKNATKETTATLKAWLYEHRKNPYPSKGEKIMLAIITKMTLTQVSTWFANARRRLKKENRLSNKLKKQNSTLNSNNSLKGNNKSQIAQDNDEDEDEDDNESQDESEDLSHNESNQNQNYNNYLNGHYSSSNKRHLNEDDDENNNESDNEVSTKKFKVDEKNFNIKPKIWSIAEVCKI